MWEPRISWINIYSAWCKQYVMHIVKIWSYHCGLLVQLILCMWPVSMWKCERQDMVHVGQFSTHSHTYHTWYMLLNHAEALCLKLHTVGTQFIIHASNPCLWIAVSTVQLLWSVYFHTSKVFIWLTLVSTSQHNIPQHFPSSVCNSMKDADKTAR